MAGKLLTAVTTAPTSFFQISADDQRRIKIASLCTRRLNWHVEFLEFVRDLARFRLAPTDDFALVPFWFCVFRCETHFAHILAKLVKVDLLLELDHTDVMSFSELISLKVGIGHKLGHLECLATADSR